MFSYLKYVVFIIVIALAAAGCCPAPLKPDTVYKYELVKPSENMLQRCKVTAPPDKEVYSNATAADKETYLFNLSSDLYADLKLCNSHWATLKQWYVDQEKVYNK